jgi:chloramphenicol 3-O phosphotransferase
VAGRIVVLNGASSSGKTSIAQAMRTLAERPWFWVTTDHFWPMMPPRFDPSDEVPLRRAASEAFLRSLLAISGAGWDVVADAVIIHPAFRAFCGELLAEAPAHLVGVRCRLDELERRERARGDRGTGLARSQLDRVHAGVSYDFEVDTSEATPEECAAAIRSYLEEARAPTAFRQLRDAQPV